ncbi:MAG: hypothetical protein HRU26_12155 [Psychroserpens sp.]|nr:hypothetical protein [Psychroserpens sp.]
MVSQSIALYDNTNGVVMIAVFAAVCVTLIALLVNFMVTGDKKDKTPEER